MRLASQSTQRSREFLSERGLSDAYGAGNCQTIFNMFHVGEFIIRDPFGKRITQGADLLPMANEMERRFNSFLLVSILETLDGYIKTLYGKMLFQLRNEVKIKDKKDFHKALRSGLEVESTPAYFDQYVQKYACKRDCKKAIAAFEEHLEWNRVGHKEWMDVPWNQFALALAFCRHRIVHNEGRVNTRSLNDLSVPQRSFVTSCLHTSLHNKEELILPSTAVMDQVFDGVASYGWCLYILLTSRCAMKEESEFFRPGGTGKRPHEPKWMD